MLLNEHHQIDNEQLRKKTAEIARKHKASWIEFGRYLHPIYQNKLYKAWGFLTFEGYCKSELGIKEATAGKLLKSYRFLENEEPQLVKEPFAEDRQVKAIPNYEAVNILRLAKQNQNITAQDFAKLRSAVLENNQEPKELRSKVKAILAERTEEEKDPADVRRLRRNASIKRVVTFLTNMKKELESDNLLPPYLLKQISELAAKLEDQLA